MIEILRKERNVYKKKTTISVIITKDGFINQFSLNKLQKLNIKVEWEQTIRKMIIDQMKYWMYDILQEVVDLGRRETKYSITFWNSSEGFTTWYVREISIVLNWENSEWYLLIEYFLVYWRFQKSKRISNREIQRSTSSIIK